MYLNHYRSNVDTVESEPAVTLAHLITAGLSSDHNEDALDVAKVVQLVRTEVYVVVGGFLYYYKMQNDTNKQSADRVDAQSRW